MVILIIVLFNLAGCIDPYGDVRPIDFLDTKWVSESPDMYFDICQHNYGSYIGINALGELNYNNQTYRFEVEFDEVNGVYFLGKDYPYEILFVGTADFSPEKMIVYINTEEKSIFGEDITEITFVKEPLKK